MYQFLRGKKIVKHISQTLSPLIPHKENMKKITKQIGKTSYLIQKCMFLMKRNASN
jgi:hypothetical protein